MQRSMSPRPVKPAPEKSGLGDLESVRGRNAKMDAVLRHATGPRYSVTCIEEQLNKALASRSKVA